MSTRATYHFTATEHHQAITFYIHHDGYPAGAAHYFASMLALDNERGGWPCMFLRANDGAEITASHEAHGDTEYRYTLDQRKRTVERFARVWDGTGRGFESARFPSCGTVDVRDFIVEHAQWDQTPRDFATLCGRYVAKEKALAWVRGQLAYAQAAFFQGWTGNSSGALDVVQQHVELLTPNERNICAALDAALKLRLAA